MSRYEKRELTYKLLKSVPKGKVTTYAELARKVKTSPRAVAVYMKTNKDPVNIPCFKVVMSDGKIGGYSATGGTQKKAELLKKHGILIKDGRIDLRTHLHKLIYSY